MEMIFKAHKDDILLKGIDHTLKYNIGVSPVDFFAYYHQIELEKIKNEIPNMLKDSVEIRYEDVYYTYLVYEPIPPNRKESEEEE